MFGSGYLFRKLGICDRGWILKWYENNGQIEVTLHWSIPHEIRYFSTSEDRIQTATNEGLLFIPAFFYSQSSLVCMVFLLIVLHVALWVAKKSEGRAIQTAHNRWVRDRHSAQSDYSFEIKLSSPSLCLSIHGCTRCIYSLICQVNLVVAYDFMRN